MSDMKLEVMKWVATVTLITGFGLVSSGESIIPGGTDIGWFFQIGGGILWLWAAIVMRDRPLILTNGAMTTVGIVGKLYAIGFFG